MTRAYLIITFHYAPTSGPRIYRWQPIAEAWAARGYRVDVICEQPPGTAAEEVMNGVYIHRVKVPYLWEILRGPTARAGPQNREEAKEKPKEPPTLAQHVRQPRSGRPPMLAQHVRQQGVNIVKWVWNHFYWPEDRALWISPAAERARRLMDERSYDALISVSWRVVSHFVAQRLHRPNRSWAWVMDMGDPFSFHVMVPANNFKIYKHLNRWADRLLFRRADAVAVTTPRTSTRYAAMFPESRDKIHVIPPMFSAPPPAPARFFPRDNKIRLVFTGDLKRINRRPETLLAIFRHLQTMPRGNRLELHFAGSVSQCADAFHDVLPDINRTIYIYGTVPRVTAIQMTHEADILINIGYVGDYQLPSKLVDYVSTGKPIVNLAVIENDVSADYLSRYPAALLLTVQHPDDIRLAAEAIHQRLVQMPPPVPREVIEEILIPHHKDRVIQAYDDLIEATIRQRSAR